MLVTRAVTLTILGAVIAAPLTAQGLPRFGRRGAQPQASTAPRLMVANPYAGSSADSANAVRVGDGIRSRMDRVAGGDFQVIPDSVMNSALTQYGYSANAILTPQLAVTLAKNIQARTIVNATMARAEGNRYSISARFSGVNDDAGYVVSSTQPAGTDLYKFGESIAEALKPAVESYEDAKKCVDNSKSKPDDAKKAAEAAIKKAPGQGLAHLCLAQIAIDRKAPRPEIVSELQATTKADPGSLVAWTLLADQQQSAGDTAGVVTAFREMLRIAPTNATMRQNIFRYLLQAGQPKVAVEVADEGIKLDPYNWDLYDLKSNACLFLSDFKCAIDALETAFELDSVRADTLFYTKVAVAASQQPDTARLLKWASAGVKRYPDNVTLLGYLNQGYVLSGQVDQSLGVTKTLMAKDPENACRPALAAAQALNGAKRLKEAGEFATFVEQKCSPEEKQNLALLYVNAALPLLQDPKDLTGAADFSRKSVALSAGNAQLAANANYVLGLSTFFAAAEMDGQTEKAKSCDMAKQEDALLQESEAALTAGEAAKPDAVKQYKGYIAQFKPRIASMLKAYCK